MSQLFELKTDDLDSIKGVDTCDMHADKVMHIVQVILARIDGYSSPSFFTITDTGGNFVQVAGNKDAFCLEWGTMADNAVRLRLAGHAQDSGCEFALLSSKAHYDLYTAEVLNAAEIIQLVSTFLDGDDLTDTFAWRELSPPFYGARYDAIVVEPQFLDQSWVHRINFKGQHSQLYKPVEFNSETDLWRCLNDLGVYSLREFGNKAEWLDSVDVELLKKWGAVRDTIPFNKKLMKEHLEYSLGKYVDPIFVPLGFSRRKNSLDYKRINEQIEQNLRLEFNFRYGRLSLSLFSRIFAIEKMLHALRVESLQTCSISGIEDLNYEPVEACQHSAYMEFYDRQSLIDLFERLHDFFQSDLVVYFDIFSSVEKLVTAFENSDPLLLKQRIDKFAGILVAAYLVSGNYDSARSVINEFRALPDFRHSAAADELEMVVSLAESELSVPKLNGD
ncbi:MAG: hypothetical protein R3F51_16725 [Cyanobacteriota/Melainabacteria group bacterium]